MSGTDLLESLFKNARQAPVSVKSNKLDELFAKAAEEKRLEKTASKATDPLTFVKSTDPLAKNIILSSKQCALYKFSDGKWVTTDITGPLFVYERLDKPLNSLFIASKTSNFIRPLNDSSKLEFKSPFIFLHLKHGESFGICFKDVTECPKFFEVVTSVTKGREINRRKDTELQQFLNKSDKRNEVCMTYSEKTIVAASFKSKNVTKKIKASNMKTFIQSELVDVSDQNLKCIKMIDPLADKIVCQASHGALYNYCVETDEWIKSEVGGPFFIYSRKDRPFYSYMIANRQSLEDWIQPIKKDMRFECNSPYIFTNIPKKEIKALWFGDEKECIKVYQTLVGLKEKLEQSETNVDNSIDTHSTDATSASRPDASSSLLNSLFPTPVVKIDHVESPVVEEVEDGEEYSDEYDENSEEEDVIHEQYEELKDVEGNEGEDVDNIEETTSLKDRPVTVHTAPKVLEALFGTSAKPSSSEQPLTVNERAFKYVKCVDKDIGGIEYVYKSVALYNFDLKTKNWIRTDVHGPLFVYSRTSQPKYKIMLASKETGDDFVLPLNDDLRLTLQASFIFGKGDQGKLYITTK
uniref:CNH domain-containing protein n=1 Tax=Bursaphelenchus xylophilus TaxID=6326 RepID=A0A1I7S325_BURXY